MASSRYNALQGPRNKPGILTVDVEEQSEQSTLWTIISQPGAHVVNTQGILPLQLATLLIKGSGGRSVHKANRDKRLPERSSCLTTPIQGSWSRISHCLGRILTNKCNKYVRYTSTPGL